MVIFLGKNGFNPSREGGGERHKARGMFETANARRRDRSKEIPSEKSPNKTSSREFLWLRPRIHNTHTLSFSSALLFSLLIVLRLCSIF